MKKSLSIILLVCMLLSMFAGTGFTLRSEDGTELVTGMAALAPVAEEAPQEEAPVEEPPIEEPSSEDAPIVSGDAALVPVETETAAPEAEEADEAEAPAEDGASVSYVDWDGTTYSDIAATVVESSSEQVTWGADGQTTWYVVTGDGITLPLGVVVKGDVMLILADGASLTVTGANKEAGIKVTGADNSLTIYGQTNGTGTLTVNGGARGACIGSGDGIDYDGSITINGGKVIANAQTEAAGIGSGNQGDNKGTITINGGTVEATGGDAGAGIGGGNNGDGGTITINGGSVTATGKSSGAGIGGGAATGGNGGNITITGGTVTATVESGWGAGIGGGQEGNGGTITITGGTVTATAKLGAVGIGAGKNGSAGTVTVKEEDLVVKAGSAADSTEVIIDTNSDGFADDLSGNTYVKISPPEPVKYIDENGDEKTCETFKLVTPSRTELTAGWWVVYVDVTRTSGMTVTGDVKLILMDGKTLTVTGGNGEAGIEVSGESNSLKVYGQSGGTGTLAATGGAYGAGIGGNGNESGDGSNGNNITINGGTIYATGSSGGAGIGGGSSGYGSYSGGSADNITINGGTVTATGDTDGAGIGGGGGMSKGGSASNITINGGTVTAVSSSQDDAYGAGIGAGSSMNKGGSVSNIAINGGTVTATGGTDASGIGLSNMTNNGETCTGVTVAAGLTVKAGSSPKPTTVITDEGETGFADDLSGKQYVTISVAVKYIDENGDEKTCTDYKQVTNATATLTEGWWVVNADTIRNSGMTVTGTDVNLILVDDKTLTVTGGSDQAGINVTGTGSILKIYGQTNGTGTLNAVGSSGRTGISGGTLTIIGGTVNATGGSGGSGIGGSTTVLGGTLNAAGGDGGDGITGACFVATTHTIKAGDSADPTEVIKNNNSDIVSLLVGKRYVTIAKTVLPNYTIVLSAGEVWKSADNGENKDTKVAGIGEEFGGITGSGSAQDGYTYAFNKVDFETKASTAIKITDTTAAITLTGTNTVKGGDSTTDDCYGINAKKTGAKLSISGEGSLTVEAGNYTGTAASNSVGIYVNELTVSSGTITATCGEAPSISYGIRSSGDITIKGGTVSATGGTATNSCGIRIGGVATIEGGTVNATGGSVTTSVGIYFGKAASITGGTVIASGNTQAVFLAGSATLTLGDVAVTASKTNADGTGAASVTIADFNSNIATYKYAKIVEAPVTLVLVGGEVWKSTDNGENKDTKVAGIGEEFGGITGSGTPESGYTYAFNGVSFTTKAATAMSVKDASATITLTGTNTVTGTGKTSVSRSGIEANNDTGDGLTISGTGSLTVNGGDTTQSSIGLACGGNLTVTSGTVTAVASGTDYSVGIICIGKITVSGGTLTGVAKEIKNSSFGIQSSAAADAVAKITGTDTVLTFESNENAYKDGNGNCPASVTLTPAPPVASVTIDGTTTNYSTLTAAWTAAQAGTTAKPATLKLLDNVTGNVTNATGAVVTLDLNGFVLNGGGTGSVITNSGTLTIKDSSTDNKLHHFTESSGLWVWDSTETAETHTVTGGVITGGSAAYGGGGINNNGTLTVTGVTVTGNTAVDGGGIYNSGILKMTKCSVSENSSKNAGIFNNEGTLEMTDCTISGNTASGSGGGIANYSPQKQATLKITGGTVSGNTAAYGGGINNVGNFATLEITDCIITDNKATNGNGGGIYSYGTYATISLTGCTLTKNSANSGGGIYNFNKSTVIITDGTNSKTVISQNTAAYGGGIGNSGGTIIMTGGTIYGNTAANANGASAIDGEDSGTVVLTGGTITGNTGGISAVFPLNNTVYLGGTVVISGNKDSDGDDSNLLLKDQTIILGTGTATNTTVAGAADVLAPADGMKVGIDIYNAIGAFTSAAVTDAQVEYFTADDTYYIVEKDADGKAALADPYVLIGSVGYKTVAAALAADHPDETATQPTTLILNRSLTENAVIPSGRNIVLDLNGNVLKAATAGSVITNYGTLKIQDNYTGTPTHNFSVDATTGLWTLNETEGTKPVSGGVITGGKAAGNDDCGGGIHNFGVLTLEGGTVAGNKASFAGAGVYVGDSSDANVKAKFTMTGGSICGNASTSYSGGIGASGVASIALLGGEVSCNTSVYDGGGAFVGTSDFTLGGGIVITGNTMNGTANNLYVPSGNTVAISTETPLASGAKIGVTMQTPGTLTTNGAETDLAYITPDSKDYYAKYVSDHIELVAYALTEINAKTVTAYATKPYGTTDYRDLTLDEAKYLAGKLYSSPVKNAHVAYAADGDEFKCIKYNGSDWVDGNSIGLDMLKGAKNVYIIGTTHEHSWVYSLKDQTTDTLVADCQTTHDPKPTQELKISATNEQYDGQSHGANLSATTFGAEDTLTINYSGTGSTVYSSTTAPTAAGTYKASVTVTGADNKDATAYVEFTITPKQLYVSGTMIGNKTYDGTTDAEVTVGTVSGIVGKEDVKVTATGTFADKLVGEDKSVAVTYVLSGAAAANYAAPANGEASASIFAKTITITGTTAETKTYDGSTDASVTKGTVSGIVTGDDVTVNASGSFDNKNVGTGKDVEVSYALTGNDAQNYTLATASETVQADITKATLTVTGTTLEPKTYDGTTDADVSAKGSLAGAVSGDDVSIDTAAAAYENAKAGEDKKVNVTYTLTGNDADNYTVSNSELDGDIDARKLTVSGTTAANKTYDGTTDADITAGSFTNLVTNDAVNLSAEGDFESANAADSVNVNVTFSITGKDAANYEAPDGTVVTANISKRQLTITDPTVSAKDYDGTVSVDVENDLTPGTLGNRVDGDDVDVAIAATYVNADAAKGKAVNVTYTLTGEDADNYLAPEADTVSADINRLWLTVTGTTLTDKTYDGSTEAEVGTVGTLDNIITGDNVSLEAKAQFDSKNAADSVDATVTYSISGTDAKNYLAPESNTTLSAEIFKADLTVNGTTVKGKTYDGNTDAEVTVGTVIGIVGKEDVKVTATGSFADKKAGADKAVTVTYQVSGEDAANYNAPAADASLTATVAAKPVTMKTATTAATRDYDGTVTAQTTLGTYEGVVAGDTAEVVVKSATFADKTAGENKTVTVTYEMTGADAANYTAPEAAEATATINKVQLIIQGTDTGDKVYDATTGAEVSEIGTVSGIVEGDDVTVKVDSARFADAKAAQNKDVTTAFTLEGADAANYLKPVDASDKSDITPKTLTVTGVSAENKVYDGKTTAKATVTGFEGNITGDDVQVVVKEAHFGDKNVGQNKTVTVSYEITGADKDNYKLAADSGSATASITKAALTVSGTTAEDKTYDGTTDATVKLGTVSGKVTGDAVTAEATGKFTSKNIGKQDVTVSYKLTGADAANYTVSGNNAKAEIKAKQLTVSGTTAQDKEYDGTTAATVTVGTLQGVIGSEKVTLSATGNFDTADAGANKNVEVVYAISGEDIGNYLVPVKETLKATVNKAAPAEAPDYEEALDVEDFVEEIVRTIDSITIKAMEGKEYVLSTSPEEPTNADWAGAKSVKQNGDELTFDRLDSNTLYYIHYRASETKNSFASMSGAVGVFSKAETPEITSVTGLDKLSQGSASGNGVVTIGEHGDAVTAENVLAVYVDGVELTSSQYKAETGCINVTLYKSFLNTLKAGKHTITVELYGQGYDGIVLETSFTIGKPVSPKTGDTNNIALWLSLLTFCGAATVAVSKKRKEN